MVPLGPTLEEWLGQATQTMLDMAGVGPDSRVLDVAAGARWADHRRSQASHAVTSRVGLIYFPDQQKVLTGMRRALKPGGRIACVVYSTAENNKFFSIPVSIIRRRAQLPPPLPGQPGPFSLGGAGVLEEVYQRAGFQEPQTRIVPSPLRLSSAAECVRFERDSFGALHQMLSGLSESEREEVWEEIEGELGQFEGSNGFEGPCEMIVGAGIK